MARKSAREGRRPLQADPALPQADGGPAVTQVEAQLDVAGAVAVHGELLEALSRGPVRIDVSEGQLTQPAIQVLVAARNSARSGHDVSLCDRAASALANVIEEGM